MDFSSNPSDNSAETVQTLADQLEEANTVGDEPKEVCNTDPSGNGCLDNANLCVEMRGCFEEEMEILASSEIFQFLGEEFDSDNVINSEFMYTQCFDELYEDLVAARDGLCGDDESSSGPGQDTPNGEGGCRSLPFCPDDLESFFESFTPDYPVDEGSYGAGVASIKNVYFTQDDGSPV